MYAWGSWLWVRVCVVVGGGGGGCSVPRAAFLALITDSIRFFAADGL